MRKTGSKFWPWISQKLGQIGGRGPSRSPNSFTHLCPELVLLVPVWLTVTVKVMFHKMSEQLELANLTSFNYRDVILLVWLGGKYKNVHTQLRRQCDCRHSFVNFSKTGNSVEDDFYRTDAGYNCTSTDRKKSCLRFLREINGVNYEPTVGNHVFWRSKLDVYWRPTSTDKVSVKLLAIVPEIIKFKENYPSFWPHLSQKLTRSPHMKFSPKI
jgi:hypothetical protein